MNFFKHQDNARRHTFFLILSFVLVIIVIVAIIDAGVIYYAKSYGDLTNVLLIVNAVVVGIILLGSIAKYLALRQGGKAIAKMINATPIPRDAQEPEFRKLINVVDEIAIASGIASPALFYMAEEQGINAFVSGFDANDTVLVVTKGALEQLNREELQGVIAHEFSHIFNGDTTINLRLVAVLGGLYVLSQMGYYMVRNIKGTRNSAGVPLMGAVLYIFGYIGLFFGNVIKSAISRQRELLSDASAVQFTRDPQGICKALLKIGAQGNESFMRSKNSGDISHMCFTETIRCGFMNPFSTHPKLEARIKALDPTGEITNEFLQQLASNKPTVATTAPSHGSTIQADPHKLHILAGVLLRSIGNPSATSYAQAQQLLQQIPEDLKTMTRDVAGAQELVLKIIAEPQLDYLILLEMCLPTLKQMDKEAAKRFVKQAFASAMEDQDLSFHAAIVLTILREHLGAEANTYTKPLYNNKKQLAADIACIKTYLQKPDSKEYQILELTSSLKKLRHMTPKLKQEFLSECVDLIQQDGKISAHEVAILRAICACLDCPIPLL